MVGRDDELRAIVSAWRREQRGVVVPGPPGIGRTTMALEVAGALAEAGGDVMLVRVALSSQRVPLGALAPRVLDEVPDGVPLVDAVSQALRARATPRFVVVVDDAHLLDAGSASALADLVDDGIGFVVATALDDALHGPLLTHPALLRVPLGQLDVDAVAALLASQGADVADPTPWWERTGGNPTAVLRMLDRHLDPASPSGLPEDVLDTALAAVTPAVRRVLDVLAVAEPLPVAAVGVLAEDGVDAEELVDELFATRLVERLDDLPGGTHLRYLHTADALTILDQLPRLRLRSVVRLAVRAIREVGVPRSAEALVRVVALSLQVGEPVSADELEQAAAAARDGADAALAGRLARAAATATGALDDVRRWVDLAYEHGDDVGLDEALTLLRELAVASPSNAEASEARVVLGLAAAETAFWRRADAPTALDALVTAADAASGTRRDEVLAVRARVLAATGRVAEAIDAARPLVDSPDARVRAQAAAALGHAYRRRGSPAAGVAVIDEVLDRPAADDTVLLVSRQVLGAVRTLALLEGGRWVDATVEAEQARARAERYDDAPGRAVATLALAAVRTERGHLRTAIDGATRAVSMFEELDQPAGIRWALSVVGLAAGLAGESAIALGAVDRLDAMAPHPATLLAGIEARARAWVTAGAHPDTARRLLLDAAADLAGRGDLGAAAACLLDLSSFGDAPEAVERFEALGLDPDEPVWSLHRAHLDAAADHDADRLGELSARFAELGGDRWAAECAASAAGAAARAGERREARRWATVTAERLAACDGLATPTLVTARIVEAGAVPLTPRERDVALLAAAGVTSREIAERLGLSVRTVDNHVASCFDKLGVRTRAELAPLLGLP